MKKYINPETFVLKVASQTIICASGGNGDNPKNARAPQRRVGGLF